MFVKVLNYAWFQFFNSFGDELMIFKKMVLMVIKFDFNFKYVHVMM